MYNRSCRIVLPFLNGLDSDDDNDDDHLSQGTSFPLEINCDSTDEKEEDPSDMEIILLSETFTTALELYGSTRHHPAKHDVLEVDLPSSIQCMESFEGNPYLKTPSGGDRPALSNLMDEQVLSEESPICLPYPDDHRVGDLQLPTSTPLKEKGRASEIDDVVSKESPNCIMAIPCGLEGALEGINNVAYDNEDFFSL